EMELLDRVKDLEKERDDWRQTASDQVERIKGLEEALELKSVQLAMVEGKMKVLEDEKVVLMAKLDRAKRDHHKIVREFIPTVVKRLHTSVEYRQSLAAPVSLYFTASLLGGLSLGRTEGQIAAMLSKTRDLDIEVSKSWEVKHHEIFTMQYPYVQKVVASYHLPVDDLMKISPDVPASHPKDGVETSAANDTGDTTQISPPAVQETTADTPFKTTT
ncbi:hypothetical protein Tco_0732801, partial [Tanacetum coccineum]